MDSDLGESYGSLANVQLPSWNHAGLRGIRSNVDRVIAAVALSCTIPSASSRVTDYSIRFNRWRGCPPNVHVTMLHALVIVKPYQTLLRMSLILYASRLR